MKQQKNQRVYDNQEYKKRKLKTLIGSLLIQFSSGIIPIWGNANLYYLSFFKNNGQNINKDTNSWILISIVFPMCILLIGSAKICHYVGYLRLLRICSYIFFISPIMCYIKFNLIVCSIFVFIIPICATTIAFIPLYNSLWSYFYENKNTVTGYSLVSYGIGGSLLNIMFLYLVNPLNIQATENDGNGFVYFNSQISQNVKNATKIIYLIVSLFFLIGAQLIYRQDQINSQKQKQKQNRKDQNKHQQLQQQLNQQLQVNIDPDIKKQVSPSVVLQTVQIQMKNINNGQIIESQSSQSQNQVKNKQYSIKKYLFNWKFIIIFFNILCLDFYITFLLNNFKLIYISSINDDHFLGYCLIANTITAIFGTFIWGLLGDKFKFVKTMIILIIVDTIIKIFGIFSDSKTTLFLLMLFLGFTSRGMATISGPGLIQIFGLKIGTQLLGFKAIAVVGSFICVPILQLIFLTFMSAFTFMNLLILINFGIILSSLYLQKKMNNQQILD